MDIMPSNNVIVKLFVATVIISTLTGIAGGALAYSYLDNISLKETLSQKTRVDVSNEESAITDLVDKTNPSVVSISISKEIQPNRIRSPFDFFFGPNEDIPADGEEQTIGGGSGFIVSQDGLIVTNKHVVSDDSAKYTVLLHTGETAEAEVLLLHPSQDLALIKINNNNLTPVEFADSDSIKVGQTAVAIGNALAEFDNTVSRGVISGLSRSIIASDGQGNAEALSDIIQTDAAINPGNSGGPLLDINGKVIGVNVATAQGAQSIGFAIPSNVVVKMIDDYREYGEVRVPYLGVRYSMLVAGSQLANAYGVDAGALIIDDEQDSIIPNSPASKAGLQKGDVIIKIDEIQLSEDKPLANVINSYTVGDTVILTIVRDKQEQEIEVTLEQRSNS